MGTFGLTFDQLREANLKRIPLFKNGKGEIAHPPTVVHAPTCMRYRLPPGFEAKVTPTTKTEIAEQSVYGCDCGRDANGANFGTVGSDWSLGEWVTAVCGELGELANLIKKVRRGDLKLDDARAELAKELADVACYLDILALQCGVDLGDAVVNKFNEVSKRIGVDVKLGYAVPIADHPDEWFIKQFKSGHKSLSDMIEFVAKNPEFVRELIRQRDALRDAR